ncbi:MAG: cupin domain-containing protein [bacterium]|nr:cupin domain-containing protein [bacterium]
MEHASQEAKTSTQTTDEVLRKSEIVEDSARGIIEKLAEGDFHSVLRITSKAGTVRANHYHKRDSHLCYLVSGKIEYVYRDALDEHAPLQRMVIEPGQLFYSPPMVAHAMVFLEDSEFYCFTTSARHTQADYEDDLVRVTLVPPTA